MRLQTSNTDNLERFTASICLSGVVNCFFFFFGFCLACHGKKNTFDRTHKSNQTVHIFYWALQTSISLHPSSYFEFVHLFFWFLFRFNFGVNLKLLSTDFAAETGDNLRRTFRQRDETTLNPNADAKTIILSMNDRCLISMDGRLEFCIW